MTTAPAPLCEQCFRRPAAAGHHWCARCYNFVPAAVVRELIWRIQRADKEITLTEIARRAEANYRTLSQLMLRTSVARRLGRDKYLRLLALADEMGA